MKEIVTNQRRFFASHQTKDVHFRIEQLKKLERVLRENEELLIKAVHDDMNKSSFECLMSELLFIYMEIQHSIKHLKRWSKKKYAPTNFINFPATSYIVPEPLGVVLIIGTWNYPYQLSLIPVVSALSAGNVVILKPSEIASHSSNAMAKLINENFDPTYLKVVEGDSSVSTALLAEKFDKIFFTGSTTVGKIIAKAAAEHLTPVSLELGGKCPVIITENVVMNKSVRRLVWAKFLNAGQTCVSPDYVYVHKDSYDEFLIQLKKEITKRGYSIEKNNYSRIINQKHAARIVALIDEQKIYHGGKYDIENRFIEPTILINVTPDDPIMQEEVFGPVLPIIVYEKLDDVIEYIQSKPSPLALYLFTTDAIIKKRVLNELTFGGGAINDAVMHIANHALPFGGVGNSGYGAYHGKTGFSQFSHYKSILDKPTWFEPSIKYSPHTKSKLNWLKWLIKMN